MVVALVSCATQVVRVARWFRAWEVQLPASCCPRKFSESKFEVMNFPFLAVGGGAGQVARSPAHLRCTHARLGRVLSIHPVSLGYQLVSSGVSGIWGSSVGHPPALCSYGAVLGHTDKRDVHITWHS